MSDEVTMVLEELANRFEMAGGDWTGEMVAEAIRAFAIDRDVPLSNRDEE